MSDEGGRFRLLSGGPFRFGFVATIGVLLALLLGLAVSQLTYALTLIAFAIFVSLGLYPVVQRLERLKMSRGMAVLVVLAVFVVLVAGFVWLIVPIVVEQTAQLVNYLPTGLTKIEDQEWFQTLNDGLNGLLTPIVTTLENAAADPNTWLAISGGALRVSLGIINGIFGVIFVVALTIYFVTSLESMKAALYDLAPASRRTGFVEIAEEIFESVGKHLSGMFLLALINASFTFILLTILGVPWAPVLAAFALPITFIPVVGSLISAALMVVVSLFTSPTTGLIVLIVMLVYLQIEAYLLTPRIVGKAISIPGSLVLIGAMVGATLLGLLGALIACPVSAAILLIIKKVVVPQQKLS